MFALNHETIDCVQEKFNRLIMSCQVFNKLNYIINCTFLNITFLIDHFGQIGRQDDIGGTISDSEIGGYYTNFIEQLV